jgi:DNA-binding response OmpR family regulator
MRALIKEYLRRTGIRSRSRRFSEAVSKLAVHSFDAVLTDLRIPDGDGMIFLRA